MGGLGSSSEQQYSLRWNDFHSSILSSFRHLRDEEDFVDVTLACDGCSFTAHKVVLSACSPYFRTLLKANPCQHPIVILRDVREQDMEALLRFMYNGEVHIGQEQLTDFLKTAQTLQVRGLADVPTKEQQKLLTGGSANAVAWMNNNNNNINSNNSNETTRGGSPAGSLGLAGVQATTADACGAGSPPIKRSRSSELGSSNLPNRFSPSPASSGNTNNNHQTNAAGPLEMRESLLSQALESSHNSISSNNLQLKGNSDSSIHAHSTGEESNSSDTALSERGLSISGNGPHSISDLTQPKSEPPDYLGPPDHHNSSGIMDPSRNPNFPAALLGLQGLPGLLPGPSGMHGSGADNSFGLAPKPVCPESGKVYSNNSNLKQHIANVHSSPGRWESCHVCGKSFKTRQYLQVHLLATHVSRRGLDMMRVRATDPRPCPKCGKIYRSAHTLRTHLEDKHTVCPGYRCVLCGTVAKSRNSLHSHMSRQHRGISTKDLPVLPMPSPFDPELASRLLAKAGVKVSAAELRARSSPTGPPRRPDIRLELKSSDDPEDLTVHNNHSTPAARYCSVDIRPLTPPHMPPGSRHPLASPPPPGPPHHLLNNKDSRGPSTGSAILDTYLQFIAENSANLHLSAEQAAKVAARVSEEQRRLAAIDDRVTAVDESSGAEDEDDFSEEEREPEPIKAE